MRNRLPRNVDGKSYIIIRQAGETGQLYGSVATRDISDCITAEGVSVNRAQIEIYLPIKTIGLHMVPVRLHPEVEVKVTVNVARSLKKLKSKRAVKASMHAKKSILMTSDLKLVRHLPKQVRKTIAKSETQTTIRRPDIMSGLFCCPANPESQCPYPE